MYARHMVQHLLLHVLFRPSQNQSPTKLTRAQILQRQLRAAAMEKEASSPSVGLLCTDTLLEREFVGDVAFSALHVLGNE